MGIGTGIGKKITYGTDDGIFDLRTQYTSEIGLFRRDAHEFISTTGTITTGTSQVVISSGIDSTYDIYELHFINMKSPSSNTFWRMHASVVGSSAATLVTDIHIQSFANESGGSYSLSVYGDNSNDANWIQLSGYVGNSPNSDESGTGILRLYSPSNTTYAKMFDAVSTVYYQSDGIVQYYTGGFWNTTSAIDKITFYLFNDIADGEIRLYGIKNA